MQRSGHTSRPAEDSIEVVLGAPGEAVAVRRRGRPPATPRGYTPREREILTLVADGMSNSEIARALGISRRTVEKHIESIHSKAGTTTRARLVAYAATATFAEPRTGE